MKINTKLFVIIFLLLMGIGILYLVIEFFFPTDCRAVTSIVGTFQNGKLIKEKQNNHYYISFIEYDNGKSNRIRMKCTKKQYDFIVSGEVYHIIYKKNFFNRKTGKVIMIDNKPIWNGNQQIAYITFNLKCG